MTRTLRPASLPAAIAAAILATGLLLAASGVARADCNADFGALMTKRMTEINALNKISKANGGKLDPIAACPRLRSLASAEGEVVSYMTKNKDWCNLPDDVITKMTATQAKTTSFATKACGLVAKMKQMQAEQQKQAQGQAQAQQEQAIRLPTGPL